MPKYQIIATIEGFDLDKKEIMLRGINKYCFEKENKEKENWTCPSVRHSFHSVTFVSDTICGGKQEEVRVLLFVRYV